MQSIWPSTVNVLRSYPKLSSNVRTRLSRFSTSIVTRQDSAVVLKKERIVSFASNLVSTAVRSTSILPSSSSVEDMEACSDNKHGLRNERVPQTAAHLSRAAAHAVRISVEQKGSPEAYLIIKSLQESVQQYKPGSAPNLYALQKVAIDFGQAVSPRLSMHCLLHGLLRRGMVVKAGKFAHNMIRAGEHVNTRTMHALTTALCQIDMAALQDEGFRSQMQAARARAPLYQGRTPGKPPQISSGSVQTKSTRLAMQLFFAAKQYHKHRARQMFQQLIDACLLQGEIIVVSFLFAFLVKQWQLRRAQASDSSDERNEKLPDFDTWPLHQIDHKMNGGHVLLPEPRVLRQTLDYIDAVVFNSALPDPHTVRASYEEAAQALAFVASLLNEQLLPYAQLSKVISLLTAFPTEPSVKIWVRRKKKWMYRNARDYFDEVLDDLVKKLPLSEAQNHERHKQPFLDRYSYNSLLHYALRYRSSPLLGSKILNYMATLGGSNAPDITTLNILFRSGTLLERNDLTSQALRLLRASPELLKPADSPQETAKITVIKSIRDENFDTVDLAFLSPETALENSPSTLTTYITHLTSTGRPGLVVPLLFRVLPELHVVDQNALSEEGQQQEKEAIDSNRRKCLERAVALGPKFFVVVLNALSKAGKTGLAERVWILAKQAEALSWNAGALVEPWCLPIDAYTIMMQCYAAEGRKGFQIMSGDTKDLDVKWKRRRKGGVIGWAWFVLNPKESVNKKPISHPNPESLRKTERRLVAREMGLRLVRAMRSGGRNVFDQLNAVKQGHHAVHVKIKDLRLPVPDARFFNAALELFDRSPSQHPRDTCLSPAAWRRLHRREHERFMAFGGPNRGASFDPRLEEVVLAMHDAGIEVPLKFRKFLIGKRIPPPNGTPNNARSEPLLYKRMTKYRTSAHRVKTTKSRGLPVRRFKGVRSANKTHLSGV